MSITKLNQVGFRRDSLKPLPSFGSDNSYVSTRQCDGQIIFDSHSPFMDAFCNAKGYTSVCAWLGATRGVLCGDEIISSLFFFLFDFSLTFSLSGR